MCSVSDSNMAEAREIEFKTKTQSRSCWDDVLR